ncbi:MAG TPA: HAD family hydrolase [Candidatus Sulfotelmatobacter sp.]|jgi:putative hydrolase of the HAD superfamily|nr:HAD family hydrolase [Candidatus Sulfotelmatobacter sp.]
MITTILFDFFGTLVAYSPDSYFISKRKKAYAFLIQNGFNLSYQQFEQVFKDSYNKFDKRSQQTRKEFHMYEFMEYLLKQKLHANVDKNVIQTFTKYYFDEWNKEVHYYPFIQLFISQLSKKYKLGIVTNTHFAELAAIHLERMHIKDYFSVVITSVAFGKRKPHKEIFLHALKRINSIASETIFIGDNYFDDYIGSQKALLQSVLLDKENIYPNVPNKVRSLLEFEQILKKL